MTPKMTNEQYELNMNALTEAVKIAYMMTMDVTDEDLDIMEDTIRHSETMSVFMVAPFQLGKTVDNLKGQRDVIDLNRRIRKLMKEAHEKETAQSP